MSAASPRTREHGFDAVRGLAAVAVVALHAAYPYTFAPMPGLVWAVPLDEPSAVANACFWWIEGFIMPLFFAISGYFVARSLERGSAGQVLAGRSRRLLVSFWTVGFAILTVDFLIFTSGFVLTGQATWHDFRRMKFGPAIDPHLWGPAHLWYLEYLWILCGGVCGAVLVWNALLRQVGPLLLFWPRARRLLDAIESPGLTATLIGLTGAATVLLGRHPEIVYGFQHHFIVPAWPKLLHSGLFVTMGIALARFDHSLAWTRQIGPWALAAAPALFVAMLPRLAEAQTGLVRGFDPILGSLLGFFAVTAVIGHLGTGLRWLNRPNPLLDRLAAASFWIYVTHHPLCGFLQLMLRPLGLPPVIKFVLVATTALSVCLFTYRMFVEDRMIGRLLEGEWPRRPSREPQVVPAESLPVRRAA